MNPEIIGLGSIIALILLLQTGLPVGITLFLIGFISFSMLHGLKAGLALIQTTTYMGVANFEYTTIPLYILMGVLATSGRFGEDAYFAAEKWFGRIKGGIGLATIASCAVLSAATGSSIVVSSVFTKISIPEMRKHGYDKRFACGITAAGGVLGPLIPPSIFFIVFGIFTDQSIAKLFIAGLLPGILLAIIYFLGVYIMCTINPSLAGSTISVSWKERIQSLKKTWGLSLLVIIVLGTLYTGIFTVSECGACGSIVALLFAVINRISWGSFKQSLLEAVETSCMLFIIIIGATIFSRSINTTGVINHLMIYFKNLEMPPIYLVGCFLFVFLVLGFFLDGISMMSITLPFMFPVVMDLGFDPIWFGVLTVVGIEFGLLTPPMAMNIFAVKAAAPPDITLEDVIKGTFRFWCCVLICIVILFLVPEISLVLPRTMGW